MLTLDDLDHFGDPSMAPLFAPSTHQPDADTAARVARILACLKFCQGLQDEELVPGGAAAARVGLRSVLRRRRRGGVDAGDLEEALESALNLLGTTTRHAAEDADALELRAEVEARIQAAAQRLRDRECVEPDLLAALAAGDFELYPTSELGALADAAGGFGRAAEIDLDLLMETERGSEFVRLHLRLECSLFRWSVQDGSCMSRHGAAASFVDGDDGLVEAVIEGLSHRSGRAIVAWSESLAEGAARQVA